MENYFMQFSIKYYLYFSGILRQLHTWCKAWFKYLLTSCLEAVTRDWERSFRTPLNLNARNTWKHLCRRFFLKLQTGDLQLYLNETTAHLLSFEFCIVSQDNYLQNICERMFLLFFSNFSFVYVKKYKIMKTTDSVNM